MSKSEQSPQQRIECLSTGLLINYKTNVIENKQSKADQSKSQSNQNKFNKTAPPRSASFDNIHKKTGNQKFKIEIEGHNLGHMNLNQDEYPSNASGPSQLSMNHENNFNNPRRNIKPIRSLMETRNSNKTLPAKFNLPSIEVKGNKLTSNEVASTFMTNINNIQLNEEMGLFRTQNPVRGPNDLLNMTSLIKNKPYQLSRLTINNSKTSDFNKETVALSSMSFVNDDLENQNIEVNINYLSNRDTNDLNSNERTNGAFKNNNNTFEFQLDINTSSGSLGEKKVLNNKQKFRMHHASLKKGLISTKQKNSVENLNFGSADQLPVIAGLQLNNNYSPNS